MSHSRALSRTPLLAVLALACTGGSDDTQTDTLVSSTESSGTSGDPTGDGDGDPGDGDGDSGDGDGDSGDGDGDPTSSGGGDGDPTTTGPDTTTTSSGDGDADSGDSDVWINEVLDFSVVLDLQDPMSPSWTITYTVDTNNSNQAHVLTHLRTFITTDQDHTFVEGEGSLDSPPVNVPPGGGIIEFAVHASNLGWFGFDDCGAPIELDRIDWIDENYYGVTKVNIGLMTTIECLQ